MKVILNWDQTPNRKDRKENISKIKEDISQKMYALKHKLFSLFCNAHTYTLLPLFSYESSNLNKQRFIPNTSDFSKHTFSMSFLLKNKLLLIHFTKIPK